MADVFLDGMLLGDVKDGKKFVNNIINARRNHNISRYINAKFNEEEERVYLTLDKNRLRRPLIVVKDGKPLLTDEHIQKLKKGDISWSDLIDQGIIEELDALEEESILVAVNKKDLTKSHTHLEVSSLAIFSINTSLVPYGNYNMSSRLLRGQKTQKQGAGIYAMNFLNRLDTNLNILHYPQTPIVRTVTQDIFGDGLAGGQNIVMAIINYDGYNMLDGVILNKASVDRGAFRLTHYRPYNAEKLRYSGGQVDEIKIPDKDVQGYTLEEDYRFLDEDGIIFPETAVSGGEVLIGKTSPPRFLSRLESFSIAANIRKDTSVRVKYGENGYVSKVFITESEDGNPLIRLEVRDTRSPEIGDKFASRHAQKGVIGAIIPEEDIPFTASGVKPDVIFSPFGMRRMTVSHIIEMLGGKVGALSGRYIDGTSFDSEDPEDLRKELLKLGFREDGTEALYDGRAGKEYKARIFIGNLFYMRLKHQVADKIQSRGRGRVALLTRQPTAGRSMEGGLRFGEMEKDTLVGHGASLLMKERFDSDRTIVHVCDKCGDVAIFDFYKGKPGCISCGEKSTTSPIEMSYAFKLFLDELKSLGIRPKLILKEKYDI